MISDGKEKKVHGVDKLHHKRGERFFGRGWEVMKNNKMGGEEIEFIRIAEKNIKSDIELLKKLNYL